MLCICDDPAWYYYSIVPGACLLQYYLTLDDLKNAHPQFPSLTRAIAYWVPMMNSVWWALMHFADIHTNDRSQGLWSHIWRSKFGWAILIHRAILYLLSLILPRSITRARVHAYNRTRDWTVLEKTPTIMVLCALHCEPIHHHHLPFPISCDFILAIHEFRLQRM